MTVVYIDLLFLLNLIANYLLLLAAGRMAGAALARWRIGLGAAAGALYAALIFLPGLAWLAAWPCKLASGVLMALAVYGEPENLSHKPHPHKEVEMVIGIGHLYPAGIEISISLRFAG